MGTVWKEAVNAEDKEQMLVEAITTGYPTPTTGQDTLGRSRYKVRMKLG